MTQRPTSVKIVGQSFAIGYVPELKDALEIGQNDGGTSRAKQRILVRDDLAPDQERDTLVHEILHGAMIVLGFQYDDEQELLVGALAPVLLDVLRSNPAVTAYLTSGA